MALEVRDPSFSNLQALILSKWRERGDGFSIPEEETYLIERVLSHKAEALTTYHWKPADPRRDYQTILSLAQQMPGDRKVLFDFLRGLATHTIQVVLRRMNLKPKTQDSIMTVRYASELLLLLCSLLLLSLLLLW